MHGLIFVTWERYIAERFGNALLSTYRATIGETLANAPLATRIYHDELLIHNIQALCRLTTLSQDILLREYGKYFISNGLTSYLCSYLLTQVHTARDLILTMRDAHAQLRHSNNELTPPLFQYEQFSMRPNDLLLIYNSPRQLCPLLMGAIEGAAERYGEQVTIKERTCMKKGALSCRIAITFQAEEKKADSVGSWIKAEEEERERQHKEKQRLSKLILAQLPAQEGITLAEIQQKLQRYPLRQGLVRPRIIFEGLRQLQYAGLIGSTANQPGDDMTHRRYWRVPT